MTDNSNTDSDGEDQQDSREQSAPRTQRDKYMARMEEIEQRKERIESELEGARETLAEKQEELGELESQVERVDDILRTARTRRDKVIQIDGVGDDTEQETWFLAYRGSFGWAASRDDDQWVTPTSESVRTLTENAVHHDSMRIQLIPRSELPEQVSI